MSDTLFTIGFTKKTAEAFFGMLQANGISLVADVRLNNKGQLAGYTKQNDFVFFLSLFGIRYVYWPDFAPTKELRDEFHSDHDFEKYRAKYLELLDSRGAVDGLDEDLIRNGSTCLLCSESTPEKCHRRVAAEAIAARFSDLSVCHL